jgi:DNA polymerase-3 subunit delta'
MGFDDIIGHERPIRVLQKTLATGRVAHAYLFWGPSGVGKEKVAREVARVLLCADPETPQRGAACGRCPACHKVDSQGHPDVHVLVAAGASISVGDVRSLQETLSYQAFERGRRVAIIREAFRMTREASNALLKTLEEPSAGTHIFLLAQHRNQILPTLVSRCQSLRFDPVPEDQVRRLLEARGMEPNTARAAAEISGGCPGAVAGEDVDALIDLEADVAETWQRWESTGVADRFALSSRWSSEKDKLVFRLDSLERCMRQSARARAAEGSMSGTAVDALGALFRVRRLLQQNVNTQLAVDSLFLGIGAHWEEGL